MEKDTKLENLWEELYDARVGSLKEIYMGKATIYQKARTLEGLEKLIQGVHAKLPDKSPTANGLTRYRADNYLGKEDTKKIKELHRELKQEDLTKIIYTNKPLVKLADEIGMPLTSLQGLRERWPTKSVSYRASQLLHWIIKNDQYPIKEE